MVDKRKINEGHQKCWAGQDGHLFGHRVIERAPERPAKRSATTSLKVRP
jgi:hypothetical protein